MARKAAAKGKQVADYRHEDAKRVNNPPAGLAWQDTEQPAKRRFEYDPHLDPQLVWAGKAERLSFEVEAPSIHVHERLSADDILRSVMKEPMQPALFDYEELDRSKVVDFYRHEMGWENRLILGDSLVVMSSLLEKERLGGQVQMIYIDPPYGIDYKANFQSRISSREVKEGSDHDLTREPEQIQAFRDTWEQEVHSYLTYLRDRIDAAHQLLSDTGSLFVQMGPQNAHLVRAVLDEIFSAENALPMITIAKTSQEQTKLLPDVADYLLWYAKQKDAVKYRALFAERELPVNDFDYRHVQEPDGTRRPMTSEEQASPRALIEAGGRIYRLDNATSEGFSPHKTVDFEFEGTTFHPGPNRHWLLRTEGMEGLADSGRLAARGKSLAYVRFWDDFGAVPRTNVWTDTGQAGAWGRKKAYVVETNPKILERCVAMTTDPGDLIVDPTCGSGTTAWAAEKLGRRWVAIDTSRVAVSIARERLLTAKFDYFRLLDQERGVDAGLTFRQLSRTKASAIGYGDGDSEVVQLYDQPVSDSSRVRVSGPFTVEALSRYAVNPSQENVPPEPDDSQEAEAQNHLSTLLDALIKQGIPRKGHKPARVLSVEPASGSSAIHAEGHYDAEAGGTKSFAVSIGPRFGPITVRQIDDALHDSYGYDLVVFAGFAATAEAQLYVATGKVGKFQVALLEANPDLLVADLLKQTSSSQTFRLFAAPDVKLNSGNNGHRTVEVLGVDLFDAATGETRFVGDEYVAAWFLDTDYDGLVFRTRQAFFPNGGWEKLAKTLKGTVDEDLMDQLERFESLPFEPGENKKVAVRVVDDAGTTSEVVLDLV